VPDAADGWDHALQQAADYYARVADLPVTEAAAATPPGRLIDRAAAPLPAATRALVGTYLGCVETLGAQTAALHVALARGTGEALAPEPLPQGDLMRVADGTRVRARRALVLLAAKRPELPGPAAARVDALIARQPALFDRLDALAAAGIEASKTRVHQDYHLGQLLWTGARYALLDFEGEPARPLAERRAKRSPLTDVAGMLRSYSYAAWSGLFTWSRAHDADPALREPWATLWETAAAATFLRAYLAGTRGEPFIPSDGSQLESLLELLMLDKGVYELEYELNNRPGWIAVPVEGLLRLL
jgi:trehalose synthase-fused probable maltokinase